MKRRITWQALAAGVCAFALLLVSGCSTVESRIAERPQVYQSLSASDQALVQQGKIREGMSRDVVYLAWGAPNQRGDGRHSGRSVENWIYFNTTDAGYGSFGYGGYGYGGYGYGYRGFGFGGFGGYGGYGGYGRFRHHIFYDPFYDPFFWSRNSVVSYPERTVSFQNGRVIAFQFLPPPRVF